MVKRFNNLKSALKLLRPLSGGDAVDLADTTPLGFFQAVQAGKKHITYGNRPDASKPGTILEAAIIPFATPATDAGYAKVPLSERSTGKLTQASVAQTDLAYITTGAAFTAALSLKGFRPAKATISVYGTGTAPKTSKLTGRSYKQANVTSYTFPFGLKPDARTAGYNTRKSQITSAVSAKDTNSVSFTPERF